MGLVKRTYVDGETVITADNLNDIQDAIIQNEEDITTKGTYSKPTGGIPKTDLASAVQTSLGKADTALQSSDIDNTLTVTGKAADAKKTGDEISGLKNTLSHKADVIYDTASGDIASFPDGADGLPVNDLTVGIEPVQDLHGYDYPWPGGSGKNKLPITGQSTTNKGITYTVNANGTISAKGTASGNSYLRFSDSVSLPTGTYILTDGSGSSNNNINITINKNGSWLATTASGQASISVNSESDVYTFDIFIASGQTVNLVFKPMMRISTESADFVPYSNICPISGWTGCNVSRTGKNLIPLEASTIKGINSLVSWSGNVGSYNGCTFEIITDDKVMVVRLKSLQMTRGLLQG